MKVGTRLRPGRWWVLLPGWLFVLLLPARAGRAGRDRRAAAGAGAGVAAFARQAGRGRGRCRRQRMIQGALVTKNGSRRRKCRRTTKLTRGKHMVVGKKGAVSGDSRRSSITCV